MGLRRHLRPVLIVGKFPEPVSIGLFRDGGYAAQGLRLPWRALQGVELVSGSAASPRVGVALWLGVGFGLRRVSTSDRLTPTGWVGVAIVPRMLRIGLLLRYLLSVQRFAAIPSQ